MWEKVIDELQERDAIGDGIPVACHRHPDATEYVSEPGRLSRLAPDGEVYAIIMSTSRLI